MPNDDYIKRSDFTKAIEDWFMNDRDSRSLQQALEDIPAADVETVVHCRECKYRNQRIPVHNAVCTKCYEMDCRQGYGFCAMGERMDEDDAE